MVDFFHGIETVDVNVGTRSVKTVNSAIIGLVGTAPSGATNSITICLNDRDDAQFGEIDDKHSIPQALSTLRQQKAGMVYVINVGGGDNIPSIDDIIGSTDQHGIRTGIELLEQGYGQYGADAKILIAPNFSSHPAVAAKLHQMAEKLGAMFYTDTPLGLRPQEVVASRGSVKPLGLNIYQSASTRYRLCYPHRKVFDPVSKGVKYDAPSAYWAGVRARTDIEVGWWTSCSNKEIYGTLGLEFPMTSRINDKNSEANMLNVAGISTVFNMFGTGFNTFGNRSMAFPTNTAFENFEQVQRTKDILEQSLHYSSIPFMDADIDQGLIDSIVEFGNSFLNSLSSRRPQAIVAGECWYDPSRNPVSDLTDGWIRISYKFTPKFPAERITYEREITGEYLLNLRTNRVAQVSA